MNFVEEAETSLVHFNKPTIRGQAQLRFGGTKATGVDGGREFEFLSTARAKPKA
jgi:hypothetical protein